MSDKEKEVKVEDFINPAKETKLNFLNTSLIVLIGIALFLLIFITHSVVNRFRDLRHEIQRYTICEESHTIIKSSANELTELARLFVVNLDERFALSYIDEIEGSKSIEQALDNLSKVCPDKEIAIKRLDVAINQTKSITDMELYNMRLCYKIIGKDEADIPERIRFYKIRPSDNKLSLEDLKETAINNMFGDGYLIYKVRVNENCRLTVETISKEIKMELDRKSEILSQELDHLAIVTLILLLTIGIKFIVNRELINIKKSYDRIYEFNQKKTKTLIQNAEYDALTGIFNRRAYEEICKATQADRMSIAFLLIDMDNFKNINDSYGHTGGDKALKLLANLLKETFRFGDYVARIGGDEFAAILTDFKDEGMPVVISKINSINRKLSQNTEMNNLSISVGIALSKEGYSENLYKQADKALYSVKESTKKGCRIYDSSLN
ncbi:MAG: GGDEF domain-containing protein [Treponema sp.]|nr:GGDEF domain-containing protein [Treponema sp.]